MAHQAEELLKLLAALQGSDVAKALEDELSMKPYDPKPFVEDVVMKEPSELPPTAPQSAAAHIATQQATTLFANAAQHVPFLFNNHAIKASARVMSTSEALLALSTPMPPIRPSVVSEDDPRLRAMPSKIRKSIINMTHSSDEGKARLYNLPFADRVGFVDAILRESRYGSPLDADYPSAKSVRKSDPFLRLARGTKPASDTLSTEVFANNVPTWLSSDQLKTLGSIYNADYNVANEGDLIGGLFRIGLDESINQTELFNVVEEIEKSKTTLELLQFLAKTVRAFVAQPINVLKIAALAGMFIYGVPLNEPRTMDAIKIAAESDLVSRLSATEASQMIFNVFVQRKTSTFFDMKQFQSLEHLRRDSFYFRDDGSCPLFRKFAHARLISGGTFGAVISTLPREANSGLPGFKSLIKEDMSDEEEAILMHLSLLAVKIQPIREEDPTLRAQEDTVPYVELRVMHVIRELSSWWPAERLAGGIYNHVRLDDWARCKFDAQKEFAPLLIGESPERLKRFLKPGMNLYQLIVQEFADMGDLHSVMANKNRGKAGLKMMCDWKNFAAITIQVLGFIQSLSAYNYCHHDIKPLNILLKKIPPTSQVTYFAYPNVASGEKRDLYVPVWGLGVVAKLADQGSAIIHGQAKLPNGHKITTYIPSTRTRQAYALVYNPEFDLECYALGFLSSMLRGFAHTRTPFDDLIVEIDIQIIAWIQTCIHPGPYKNQEMEMCYAIVNRFLKTIQDFDSEETLTSRNPGYSGIITALDDIYTKHNRSWQANKTANSIDAISRALAHPIFDAFRDVPKSDATIENGGILVMTNYKYQV